MLPATIECNSAMAAGFLFAATSSSTSFSCRRVRSGPAGAASISSRNEIGLEALGFLESATGGEAGVSDAFIPGLSVDLSPVVSPGLGALLACGLPGVLTEFPLLLSPAFGLGGFSATADLDSPDEPSTTRRARVSVGVGVTFGWGVPSFLAELV